MQSILHSKGTNMQIRYNESKRYSANYEVELPGKLNELQWQYSHSTPWSLVIYLTTDSKPFKLLEGKLPVKINNDYEEALLKVEEEGIVIELPICCEDDIIHDETEEETSIW